MIKNCHSIFESSLLQGVVSAVGAVTLRVNLKHAGAPTGSLLRGARYGLGEVGEFVIIEGELVAVFGRVIEVRLPERERRAVDVDAGGGVTVDAIATIQMLGSINLETLNITAGVSSYPRLGDRVYSAPETFLSQIPMRMECGDEVPAVTLTIGRVAGGASAAVSITPERLFGRHCAVLGATGGGKSYTVSRLIEEAIKHDSKVILLDATGEYKDFLQHTAHVYLGDELDEPIRSKRCSIPPQSFTEADFLALFEPAGKTQGPKLRAAIRSLRLIRLCPNLCRAEKPGILVKANRLKEEIFSAERDSRISRLLDSPTTPFDPFMLVNQIVEECVWENGGNFSNPDTSRWGGYDGNTQSYCMSLFTRINGVLTSKSMESVFDSNPGISITDKIEEFLKSDLRLLRISMAGVHFEYSAREIIANAIGRGLLQRARSGNFRKKPLVIFVDEAHNFLGRNIGGEESLLKLDSFELIAKEGRKYGLTLCLATQRPRDITEGVLSQMGTLVVHRLTNDRDREIVERACGEIDKSASAFLPNLEPGEAAIIGVDIPIPLTIHINTPSIPPDSRGADFQAAWRLR